MKAARAYQQIGQNTAVLNAHPVDLTILLYEKLLDLFVEARVSAEAGDIEKKSKVTSKAIEIIESGLIASLDLRQGGEISINLRKLYRVWIAEILKFNLTMDSQKLVTVGNQIREVLSAFKEIRSRDASTATRV